MHVRLFQDYRIQVSPLSHYNDSSLDGDRNALRRLKKRLANVYIFVTRQLLARAIRIHDTSHWLWLTTCHHTDYHETFWDDDKKVFLSCLYMDVFFCYFSEHSYIFDKPSLITVKDSNNLYFIPITKSTIKQVFFLIKYLKECFQFAIFY